MKYSKKRNVLRNKQEAGYGVWYCIASHLHVHFVVAVWGMVVEMKKFQIYEVDQLTEKVQYMLHIFTPAFKVFCLLLFKAIYITGTCDRGNHCSCSILLLLLWQCPFPHHSWLRSPWLCSCSTPDWTAVSQWYVPGPLLLSFRKAQWDSQWEC